LYSSPFGPCSLSSLITISFHPLLSLPVHYHHIMSMSKAAPTRLITVVEWFSFIIQGAVALKNKLKEMVSPSN
jgi:hypothetical protein